MPFELTKELADGLCTLITIGFIKSPDSTKTKFQYAETTEPGDYVSIKNRLGGLGVALITSQSTPQAKMPLIAAKTRKFSTIEAVKAENDNIQSYLTLLNQNVKKLETEPYGAYIGGLSTTSATFIIGPSALSCYNPKYRKPTPSDIKKIEESFNNSKKATNDAIACINSSHSSTIVKGIQYVDVNKQETKTYEAEKLFGSYHGMIQAMEKYHTDISNSFCFEIALGANTSKVSSCIPCSIFMTANEAPPTSTHLGRGDNWNSPMLVPSYKEKWQKKIIEYYQTGVSVYKEKTTQFTKNLEPLFGQAPDDIPGIFLEALTFEGKFTDKIISTLKEAPRV